MLQCVKKHSAKLKATMATQLLHRSRPAMRTPRVLPLVDSRSKPALTSHLTAIRIGPDSDVIILPHSSDTRNEKGEKKKQPTNLTKILACLL